MLGEATPFPFSSKKPFMQVKLILPPQAIMPILFSLFCNNTFLD